MCFQDLGERFLLLTLPFFDYIYIYIILGKHPPTRVCVCIYILVKHILLFCDAASSNKFFRYKFAINKFASSPHQTETTICVGLLLLRIVAEVRPLKDQYDEKLNGNLLINCYLLTNFRNIRYFG